MKQIEAENRSAALIERLVAVWRDSVKNSHLFLSDSEISEIQKEVPQALAEIPHLIVAEDADGAPLAFMGIAEQKLEMLFLAPDARGRGLGKQLLSYGVREFAVNEVCVNEQNPQAVGFYEHMGFHVVKRTATDEQGRPYPLLYMKLR
ncbi:GNAT family N-acetyltransferase [Clostridium sp. D33t1_170424_F3]|uniref:GNAT family N-acetyltransferase n=1 Tax=Clostridium sp. D33t1_170424_F3 TaxID=2787099 RepID=UPI0018AC0DAC|nr:GNAT family N-acetyltransferase [Clostridium sp. D33t1_170424_F3]